VGRQTYQRALYEKAVEQGVKVRFGCRVEKIDDCEAGPSITLSTGETLSADLIVGADGSSQPFRPNSSVTNFSSRNQIHHPLFHSWGKRCKVTTKRHLLPVHHPCLPDALILSHRAPYQRKSYPQLVGSQHALDLRSQVQWAIVRRIFLHPSYSLLTSPSFSRLSIQLARLGKGQ
jgi:2-polyprenyl-6-methoxyphenol hydroxylase-like FAD-dependent oxidoreductase